MNTKFQGVNRATLMILFILSFLVNYKMFLQGLLSRFSLLLFYILLLPTIVGRIFWIFLDPKGGGGGGGKGRDFGGLQLVTPRKLKL